MPRRPTGPDTSALSDPKGFYDARYQQGYMQDFDNLYETCRLYTMKAVLSQLRAQGPVPSAILDYGCGEGRYFEVLRRFFPGARIAGCDISEAGVRLARSHYPFAECRVMPDETTDFPAASFDLVISVEVLEHVNDAQRAAREIGRLLRPGGRLVLTTPCANRWSLEWTYNRLTGGLQPSHDGYGRFATDDDGHLRRLTDIHLRDMFGAAGVTIETIYHRAHFFTTLLEIPGVSLVPVALRAQLALLDWRLFKHLKNGATMVALGRKRSQDAS